MVCISVNYIKSDICGRKIHYISLSVSHGVFSVEFTVTYHEVNQNGESYSDE